MSRRACHCSFKWADQGPRTAGREGSPSTIPSRVLPSPIPSTEHGKYCQSYTRCQPSTAIPTLAESIMGLLATARRRGHARLNNVTPNLSHPGKRTLIRSDDLSWAPPHYPTVCVQECTLFNHPSPGERKDDQEAAHAAPTKRAKPLDSTTVKYGGTGSPGRKQVTGFPGESLQKAAPAAADDYWLSRRSRQERTSPSAVSAKDAYAPL